MRKIIGEIGWVLLFLGAAGVIHDLTGWFRFWAITSWRFLGDYGLATSIVIGVLGLAMVAVAGSEGRSGG
jgi:hypothetical protein